LRKKIHEIDGLEGGEWERTQIRNSYGTVVVVVVVVVSQYKMADTLCNMNRLSRPKPLVNLHLKTDFIHSEMKTRPMLNFSCLIKHHVTKAY
jgi:hypothetical protein